MIYRNPGQIVMRELENTPGQDNVTSYTTSFVRNHSAPNVIAISNAGPPGKPLQPEKMTPSSGSRYFSDLTKSYGPRHVDLAEFADQRTEGTYYTWCIP